MTRCEFVLSAGQSSNWQKSVFNYSELQKYMMYITKYKKPVCLDFVVKVCFVVILGDPGADSGDKAKSKRAEKYMARRKVKNREKSPWGNVLPDQFQTVAAVLASDWCQKNTSVLAPIRSQNGGDRLELVL